jgi:alanine racemase
MTSRPNHVEIDLSALVHNFQEVRHLVKPRTRIMGVVKADAYGHGLLPVSRVLEKEGIDCLGVAHLHEALTLRRGGIRLPIVILCGIRTREEAREVVKKDLTTVLFDVMTAETLDRESARLKKVTPLHLKVDTGMGRLGIPHFEVAGFIDKIAKLKHLRLEALSSHLSSADEAGREFTEGQIKDFRKAIEVGRSMGLELPLNNLANSAGVLLHREGQFDMVRPGIMLYGGLPSPALSNSVHLKPVMHFKAQVLQIRDLPDNSPVSYGRTYYTKGPQRIAVLSAGYGDGLPRSMSNRGTVLIAGKKTPIVGKICMNMTLSDVTGVKDVRRGREAVFLGNQGPLTITGDDMAAWAETLSYEVFCSIGQRNKRTYLE